MINNLQSLAYLLPFQDFSSNNLITTKSLTHKLSNPLTNNALSQNLSSCYICKRSVAKNQLSATALKVKRAERPSVPLCLSLSFPVHFIQVLVIYTIVSRFIKGFTVRYLHDSAETKRAQRRSFLDICIFTF